MENLLLGLVLMISALYIAKRLKRNFASSSGEHAKCGGCGCHGGKANSDKLLNVSKNSTQTK